MTTYLLDTNACLALINGTEVAVRRRFRRAVGKNVMLLSSIVAFEFWYGVGKSQRKETNTQRVEAFFAGPFDWAEFDEEDAREAGTVRAELESIGKPIGAYDVLPGRPGAPGGRDACHIDTREFGKVRHLAWEDWASSHR